MKPTDRHRERGLMPASERTDPAARPVVHCAYYDVTELEDPDLWSRGMAALPWPERRVAVRRFIFGKDQRLCLGAGLLAAHMLREAGATDFALAYGAHDKPYLTGHPDLHFNISHSGTIAACAVSHVPVGIDVEEIADQGPGVAAYCYTSRELAWLDAQDDKAMAFTRLWTRKESFIKLAGYGLSRDPRTICTLDGKSCGHACFDEHELPGYALCVCTEGPCDVRLSRWSFSHGAFERSEVEP